MGEGGYDTVGDSSNVENLTQDAYDKYGKQSQYAYEQMGDVANMLKNFEGFKQREYDPTAGFGFFTDVLGGQLQGMTIGATNKLGQSLQATQKYNMYNARRELENMFGNQLGYGGQDANRAARTFGEIGARSTQEMIGAQTGMFSQLAGIGLQQAPSQFQAATEMYNRYGLQGRQQRLSALQGAGDMWSNAYGTASAGQTASYNAWEPTYVEDPWNNFGANLAQDAIGSTLGGVLGGLGQSIIGAFV